MARLKREKIGKLKVEDITEINDSVIKSSSDVMKIVNREVNNIYAPLDKQIRTIQESINSEEQMCNDTLEFYIINLSSIIYTISDKLESTGMYADISKAIRTEKFNSIHLYTGGTVADKENAASEGTLKESMVNLVWERIYKIGKLKMENAKEILASLKKIVNIRSLVDG